MTTIYLIRHAQAGTRANYDVLSELGHRQASLLGDYFAGQGVELSAIYSGGMRRQQHTAEIACRALAEAGARAPDIVIDERWNEFSLADVYRGIASRMLKDDEEFARDFEEMKSALDLDPHTTRGATGRSDLAVVRAWMENRYPDYAGESWAAFRARIHACAADLLTDNHEGAIAVFTSATPITIAAGAALALSEEKMLSVLGVLYNTNITTLRPYRGELRLLSLNSTPHLPDSLRTLR